MILYRFISTYLLLVFQEQRGKVMSVMCRQVWKAEVTLRGCLLQALNFLPLGDFCFVLQVVRLDCIHGVQLLTPLVVHYYRRPLVETHNESIQQDDCLQGSLLCPYAFIPGPDSIHFHFGVCHRLL